MTVQTKQANRRLSEAVQSIKPSGIRRFFDLASTMDNIISLGVGEPDFVTPWNVREASYVAMEQGYTAYTANAGLLELRVAISKYMDDRFAMSYCPEKEILVTVGGSEAIDLALRAIVNPGDEVIVVEPTFVSYAPIVSLVGGIPVSLGTRKEDDFKLTPAQIEAVVTPKTKAIILCFPNNPTGAVMTKEELEAVATVIKKHNLLVISDEIYAELSYDHKHESISKCEGMWDKTIVINGFSKAFAMTGWRLGFATGPEDIIAAMLKIHQYTMMCASTLAQYGALEALTNGMDDVKRMVQSYEQRRNYIVQAFAEIGLTCHTPGGAFYAFPSIKSTGYTSEEFAEKLLFEERVAVVPGNVFGEGGEGHIRCSYATSIANLQEAIKRMGRFLEKHQQ